MACRWLWRTPSLCFDCWIGVRWLDVQLSRSAHWLVHLYTIAPHHNIFRVFAAWKRTLSVFTVGSTISIIDVLSLKFFFLSSGAEQWKTNTFTMSGHHMDLSEKWELTHLVVMWRLISGAVYPNLLTNSSDDFIPQLNPYKSLCFMFLSCFIHILAA
jgi:hypothetical protein